MVVKMALNYVMAQNLKLLNDLIQNLPYDQEGRFAMLVEMSPVIKVKAFATHNGSLTNFCEFAVLVYDEVMKYASNYDRIDLVFDRYFEKSVKEGTRSGRGEGSQYLFEGDSTRIPPKIAESFLKNNQSKNKLNEYLSLRLLELHQGDQIMNATYRNTSLSSSILLLRVDHTGFCSSM